ncbi:MAG: type II secretion system GspH family protein [Lachnospiraceae bacterium]|nr:type II secretion system GspH family protein [Lachnospiraceae bacterium]
MKRFWKGLKNRICKADGFTLIEMVVVLTVMSIMMAATVWGVTGWIAHFEYVSSEEKARTVYLAAQSALSSAESRGVLDAYMEQLKPQMIPIPEARKSALGLPVTPDNEGKKHEYGYMLVKQGDFVRARSGESGADSLLYNVLSGYISDSQQLDGSIVVEFDLTAQKVYSAFYSGWATSIGYGEDLCQVRGDFYVLSERRTPAFRQDYQVGYFGADQVNVVQLPTLPELKMEEAMLHNEETLYLTMKSSSEVAESNTSFLVQLYEKGKETGSDKLRCSFTVDRSMLDGAGAPGEPVMPDDPSFQNNLSKLVNVDVEFYDDEQKPKGEKKMPLIMRFRSFQDAEGQDSHFLAVTLDALTTPLSSALLHEISADGLSDERGYSITRMLGIKPVDVFARVSVLPKDPSMYAAGAALDSNVENDLFATNTATEDEYLISKNRHLVNISYTEKYQAAEEGAAYRMTDNLDWHDAILYNLISDETGMITQSSGVYNPVDATKTPFPTIDRIGEKSSFNGDGHQLSHIYLNNESHLEYARKADGSLAGEGDGGGIVNKAKTLGIFGINRGQIRGLELSEAKLSALSKKEAGSTDESVYADTLEAVGLLCGRNMGSVSEIWFDDSCSLQAEVFATLEDADEAKREAERAGKAYTSDPHENQIYGCGVGMICGSIYLSENTLIDRIRTAGDLNATISDAKNGGRIQKKEVPAVKEKEAREAIYSEEVSGGETISNARYYAYGTGGAFGYVFGKYREGIKKLGIGRIPEEVAKAAALQQGEKGSYLRIKKKTRKDVQVTDETGRMVTVSKLVDDADNEELLFAEFDERSLSVVNKATVSAGSFTGGIAGNIFIAGITGEQMEQELDDEKDPGIPDSALPQLINCTNYGDTAGVDFVGGICGVNGRGGYLLSCVSHGSPKASNGVSAGITAENYGYISRCSLQRAAAEAEHGNQPYVPRIEGNMLVAGAIASVNHTGGIVFQCRSAMDGLTITDPIRIVGSEMESFGFIVGENFGVVNGGGTGRYLGYESRKRNIIIGGGVGTNHEKGIVKHLDVGFELSTSTAQYVGGVVGKNSGTIRNCSFGGSIIKNLVTASDDSLAFGGITAVNEKEGAGSLFTPSVTDCVLAGGRISAEGVNRSGNLDSADIRVKKSSAIGGICGINDAGCLISDCFVKAVYDESGKTQSELTVYAGMAGGIVAVNRGDVKHCGDMEVLTGSPYQVTGEPDVSNLSSGSATIDIGGTMENYLAEVDRIKQIGAEDYETRIRTYTARLNTYIAAATEVFAGRLSPTQEDLASGINGYTKSEYIRKSKDYADKVNHYIIRMNNRRGNVGGIVGINLGSGSVVDCASGKWLVESYLTDKYSQVAGVIAENDGNGQIRGNVNFAYVRRELADPFESGTDTPYSRTLQNNHEHYVGGVIGIQNNEVTSGWRIEGCVNSGTVLDCYSNSVGGVISKWTANGGTVERCFNYGTLITGYQEGGDYGTAGGIVGYCYDLTPDQVMNVLSCQNHGIVNLAMNGIVEGGSSDYHKDETESFVTDSRSYRSGRRGNRIANDVGGIVGKINAPSGAQLYTANIRDCVNGVDAKIYSYSLVGGILGWTGGDTKAKDSINDLFVNIDRCRNYSSDLYTFDAPTGAESTKNDKPLKIDTPHVGGILCERQNYLNTGVEPTGYTTVTNCVSMRFASNTNPNYDYDIAKIYGHNGKGDFTKNMKYCRNNYVIDERSFHYSREYEEMASHGVKPADREKLAFRSAAVISDEKIEKSPTDNPVGNSNFNQNRINNQDKNYLHARRLFAFSFETDGIRKDAFCHVTNSDYSVENMKKTTSWISRKPLADNRWNANVDDWPTIQILKKNAKQPDKMADIIPYAYDEKGVDESCDYGMYYKLDHFWFRYQKEQTPERLQGSLLPTADSWDLDFDRLDESLMQYIEYKNVGVGPDKVKITSHKKNDKSYDVRWELESEEPSATEFDVEIKIYRQVGDAIPQDGQDIPQEYDYLEDQDIMKKAYGTRTTFLPPEEDGDEIDYENHTYYAAIRVKDARAEEDQWYSNVVYQQLAPKLKMPRFEFVTYKDQWVLHLLNPKDYTKYLDKGYDFEVGVRFANNNTRYLIDFDRDYSEEKLSYYTGNIPRNVCDKEVYGFAEPVSGSEGDDPEEKKDILAADEFATTVYIPSNLEPGGAEMNISEADNGLDQPLRPEYSAILTYKATEDRKPQVFRLELYGRYVGSDAKRKGHWETVAEREYSLSAGQSETINIGYYDVPSDIALSDYGDFKVECWHASTGQGPVNYYFEVDKAQAAGKKRVSGYITDRTAVGTLDNDSAQSSQAPLYLYHRSVLPAPILEVAALNRDTPTYSFRLLNMEDYEDTTGVKIGLYFNNKPQGNTNDNIEVDTSVLDGKAYYNRRGADLGNGILAKAYGTDYSPSGVVIVTPKKDGEKGKLYLPENYSGNGKVKINLQSFAARENGCYIDEDRVLHFSGRLRYTTKGDSIAIADGSRTGWLQHYYRIEVSAKDTDGTEKTLYLSDDLELVNDGNANLMHTADISIPDLDLSGYDISSLRISAWYSGYRAQYAEYSDMMIAHYYELDEETALSRMEGGSFTRKNGYIHVVGDADDMQDGAGKDKYYFVAPLQDPHYWDTVSNNLKDYVLARSDQDTFADTLSVYHPEYEQTLADGSVVKTQDLTQAEWTGPDGSTPERFDVETIYYKAPKPESTVLPDGTVSGNAVSYTVDSIQMCDVERQTEIHEVTGHNYIAREPDGVRFDFVNYEYYVVARVKDHKLWGDSYYSKPILLKVREQLATPKIEYICLQMSSSPKWYVRLKNPEAYVGTDAIIKLKVGSSSFEIDTNDTSLADQVMPYAVAVNRDGNRDVKPVTAQAVSELLPDSEICTLTENSIWLWQNFHDGDFRVNIDNITQTEATVSGNTISFSGQIGYHGSGKGQVVPVYPMVEVYAYPRDDASDGYPVSFCLNLQDEYSFQTTNSKTKDISLDINVEQLGIDLTQYREFHVAAWIAETNLDTSNYEDHLRFWLPVTAEVAQGKSREEGIIRLMTAEGMKYYYAAALNRSSDYTNKNSVWADALINTGEP